MLVYKSFKAEIAHYLPNVPDGHPCKRLHGHCIEITLCLSGPLEPKLGWVEDTQYIAAAFKPIYDQIDHHLLNEIQGLENPTSENLAAWIWENCHLIFKNLYFVKVSETQSSGAIYYGPEKAMRGLLPSP